MARTTPARAHFSAQYANPDYADLNLVIKAPVTTQHDTRKRHHGQPDECLTWQTTEYEDLVKQPGHKVVLCAAPHFKAQLEKHWQPAVHEGDKPCVTLLLESKEQLPAATGLIKSMYDHGSFAEGLPQEQLLHFVTLSDMLGLDAYALQAVKALCAAVDSAGPSSQLLAALMRLGTWPTCLRSLLPNLLRSLQHLLRSSTSTSTSASASTIITMSAQIAAAAILWTIAAGLSNSSSTQDVLTAPCADGMLSVLRHLIKGSLSDMLRTPELLQLLFELPLPAVTLLLSDDRLAATEDLVLFAAKEYVSSLPLPEQQLAIQQLGGIIRVPFLQSVWLHEVLAAGNPSQLLLSGHLQDIKVLQGLRQAEPNTPVTAQLLRSICPPDSWFLPARPPLSPEAYSSSCTWQLPVSDLKQACLDAHSSKTDVVLSSPDSTPPTPIGIKFGLIVKCVHVPTDNHVSIAVYVQPLLSNTALFVKAASVSVETPIHSRTSSDLVMQGGKKVGWPAFFLDAGLWGMAGGWQEERWQAIARGKCVEVEDGRGEVLPITLTVRLATPSDNVTNP